MRYLKLNAPPRSHSSAVRLSAFGAAYSNVHENLLPMNASAKCYNCRTADGALRESKGFIQARLPRDFFDSGGRLLPVIANEYIREIFYYRRYDALNNRQDDRIIACVQSQRIYQLRLNAQDLQWTQIINVTGEPGMTAANYRLNHTDVMLLCTSQGIFVYDGQAVAAPQNTPFIKDLCIHYERAFAVLGTDRYKVCFSSDLDPVNWNVSLNGGGYIELADSGGAVTRVISFLNYVYIFREYGIVRLTAFAEQTSFSAQKMFTCSGRIYEKTVAVCGDKIIFLAEDGFYSFDGLNTVKILNNLDEVKFLFKTYYKAEYHNGCYYISCFINFEDNLKIGTEADYGILNCVLEFNLNTGAVQIMRGIDVYSMIAAGTEYGSELLISNRTGIKNALGYLNPLNHMMNYVVSKYWRSGYTDLGYPERQKVIRKITITTEYDISLTLNLDGKNVSFNISGSVKPQTVRVNRRCVKFSYSITSYVSKLLVTDPLITMDILDR